MVWFENNERKYFQINERMPPPNQRNAIERNQIVSRDHNLDWKFWIVAASKVIFSACICLVWVGCVYKCGRFREHSESLQMYAHCVFFCCFILFCFVVRTIPEDSISQLLMSGWSVCVFVNDSLLNVPENVPGEKRNDFYPNIYMRFWISLRVLVSLSSLSIL